MGMETILETYFHNTVKYSTMAAEYKRKTVYLYLQKINGQ